MSFTLASSSLLAPLVGDAEIAALFDAPADHAAMLAFERELAAAQAALGLMPADAARAMVHALADLDAVDDLPGLAAAAVDFVRDGLAVPAWVAAIRERLAPALRAHFHVGVTSQDLVDSSLMLRAKQAFELLAARLTLLQERLARLSARHGERRLDARTRLQRARPIRVADRLAVWEQGLAGAAGRVAALDFPVQLGGPVGTLDGFGPHGDALRAVLAQRLGLSNPGLCWHASREPVVRLAETASVLTGALGKLGLDAGLMAQNGIDELTLADGGRSSSMAHKRNPVRAEILVAVARHNAGLLGSVHQALLHEQERSGAAWTLEWLTLPPMIVGAGAATGHAALLLDAIDRMGR
ncbi:MAG: 3-carboxy-cis,cis-muconate cycloisomerase [Gammaproteobacteria bacterium]